ncbi:MAG: response regulator [Anaerolinea sp.]|nr:response regulator [Anaerolinea sp.]MCC6974635.1 response regulator [Anaerolineae bacterium]CAG1010753.1 Response regulator PleD [Anaerolineae bacterium]
MTPISDWRVLVIEDEADSMEVVKELFEHHQVSCWAVGTAEEALAMIAEVQPNLFVVDLALPGMDGWGFLKTIKDDPNTAHIPAVAVTAYHSANVARQAIDAGFRAYFPKPLDTMSFVRELSRMLG